MFLFSTLLATFDSTFAQDTICTVYNFEVERTHNYFVGKEGANSWVEATTEGQENVFNWFKNSNIKKVEVKATDTDKVAKLKNMGINIVNGKAEIALNDISLYLYGSKAGKLEMKSVVIIKP